MKISVVTTMFYSEKYIVEFYERCKKTLEKITDDYEFIFVNDGSPDDSLNNAIALLDINTGIKVIDLSRNFGHHKAMMEGLSHASGELVFLIDSDLEEEPELLYNFYTRFIEDDCDVVYGIQSKRKGNFLEKWTGAIFYRLINYLSDLDMPRNIITARLMSKRYVEKLISFREQEVFLAGLWYITGFKQISVEVDKLSKSKTSYNIYNKLAVLVNAITSFSNKPLRLIFNIGLLITTISIFYIIYLVLRTTFLLRPLEGWTSLIVSVWFLGGLIILFMGIIGIYLSKIFIETKNRPYTIVRKIYGDTKNNE